MQDCNYEKYLLEIVNTSTYFLKKSHGELYSAPIEESHSECDCCSSAYSLDFKLAASETAMRARNLFSRGSAKLAPGIMMSTTPKIGASNPSYQPIEATRIHAALRSMSLAELKKIRGCNIKCQGIERDIQAFLETMDTQKHILLFFPYEFSYGKEIAFDSAIMEIIRAVNNDFINAIKYRNEVANGFDTYLTFIYAGFFVITIADGEGLLFVDAVPTNSSKTFTTLRNN